MALKIMVDQHSHLRIVATGSSSFDLVNTIGEPLTVYPLSQLELLAQFNKYELREQLGDFFVFGAYPDVVTAETRQEKIGVLNELVDSYLLKDVLALETVKNPRILLDLLKLLAFQMGNEVSLNELGVRLGIDAKTVARYLDLLEKTFVIYRLSGFSRNLRSEVTGKNKYFFVDNGIRNAVVNFFNPLDTRDDTGALWESFIVGERLKKRAYKSIYGGSYFWRTYEQQAIDLVEEWDGRLFGYEIKWSEKKKVKIPQAWKQAYPSADFSLITPDNYLDFIT